MSGLELGFGLELGLGLELASGSGLGLESGLRREWRVAVVGVGEIGSNVLMLVCAKGIPPAWPQDSS
jgi:hypothetical protein